MRAIEAMFTESKNADINLELRSLGIKGLRNATKRKDGKKIPRVANAAPWKPDICQPIKVADEKTGPGVNWPMAIASISSCLLSNPVVTSSSSRNAKRT